MIRQMDDELEATVEQKLLIPTALEVDLRKVGGVPVDRNGLVGQLCGSVYLFHN